MPLDLPPFPLDSNKPIKEQMKLDLSPVELDSSSQPQTSHSTIYEHSLVPIRPFVSFFQRSIVRLPDHTYRVAIFFYWCLSLGFQNIFNYQARNRSFPNDSMCKADKF
jgi:hypothetical protein